MTKRRVRTIRLDVALRVLKNPCAVCGLDVRIELDHIIPFSLGGTSDEANIQPLCFWCNRKKRNRLSNDELREWVLKKGISHYLVAFHDARYLSWNYWDRPELRAWIHKNPDAVARAQQLLDAIGRHCA